MPTMPAAAPAPDGPVYRKTDAGRRVLAMRHGALGLRDRQILLLCTGERNLAALAEVFGPATAADLRRLMDRGWVEAVARIDWPAPGAAFWPTLPPMDLAAERSANASGFGVRLDRDEALRAARAQVAVLLAEIGGATAEQAMAEGAQAEDWEAGLAFITRAVVLAVRHWGGEAAMPWAERIARLLPRAARARLVDGLIAEGSATTVVAALYEQLVSDSLPGPEAGGPG